jgi:hypothetical protein
MNPFLAYAVALFFRHNEEDDFTDCKQLAT